MNDRCNNDIWVTYPRLNPQARLRLLCFPYAGGRTLTFHAWPDELPPDIEICPIQLPGRGSRLKETPFTRLPALVEAMAPALLPYLDKPFAFFGHSMGALISFELTRYLRRQYDLSPIYLFVSGHPAPQLPPSIPSLHQLPASEFVAELRRFRGAPEAVLQNTELMELFLPTLRADLAMCETYIYANEEPLNCPISAFGGRQDSLVNHDSLAAWSDQTRAPFSLRILPGDHFFLNSARTLLLKSIAKDLSRDSHKTERGIDHD
jgi:medium-chain acyl-[acyl-carrier-protein] hydrolase